MRRSPYRSHEGRNLLEHWQSARIGDLVERAVRSDLGVSVALESGGGGGTPLVALPGAGFPAVLLTRRLAGLCEGRRLIAVETPGRPGLGLTTAPDPDSDDLVTWAEVLFDALDIESADFFGHSSGGWAALRIAWERPRRVRRLVLAAPAGIVRPRTPAALLWRSLRWRIRRDAPRARRVIESVWGDGVPDSDLVEWTALLARHARTGPRAAVLPPPVLRAVAAPVLVLAGEQDPVFPAPILEAAASRHLPDVRVEVVPGAGHVLPFEAAGVVVRAAVSFLD